MHVRDVAVDLARDRDRRHRTNELVGLLVDGHLGSRIRAEYSWMEIRF